MKFWGKVRSHNKRGRELGFPTANVNLVKKIPEGVYLSKTRIDKNIFNSLTFIGKSKTFAETHYKSETYILDFQKDIYHKWITVELLKKIRASKKFSSAKDLIAEIKKDVEVARKYFKI
jgi:riboflavin kinase/FMN adenylyltransferase